MLTGDWRCKRFYIKANEECLLVAGDVKDSIFRLMRNAYWWPEM